MSEAAQPSYTCPRCGRTSYHPSDLQERYCSACNRFEEPLLGDQDVMAMHAADEEIGRQLGVVVLTTHGPEQCSGEFCSIHNPSEHHMRSWPMNWRADRGMMERICPVHGIGHPDPDGLAHMRRVGRDDDGTHGCCGCCQEPI